MPGRSLIYNPPCRFGIRADGTTMRIVGVGIARMGVEDRQDCVFLIWPPILDSVIVTCGRVGYIAVNVHPTTTLQCTHLILVNTYSIHITTHHAYFKDTQSSKAFIHNATFSIHSSPFLPLALARPSCHGRLPIAGRGGASERPSPVFLLLLVASHLARLHIHPQPDKRANAGALPPQARKFESTSRLHQRRKEIKTHKK